MLPPRVNRESREVASLQQREFGNPRGIQSLCGGQGRADIIQLERLPLDLREIEENGRGVVEPSRSRRCWHRRN